MNILALESSAKAASVAFLQGGRLSACYFQNCGLTHSVTLLKMADDMLQNLGISMENIDAVAIAVGPGSFTGIRIGVAAAKGLAFGADIPIIGVSTLEAMAHQCHRTDVRICPVMDARRSQVYNAVFAYEGEKLVRIAPDRAISVDELINECISSEKCYFLIGDGAEMCYNIMSERGCNVILSPEICRFQSAAGVAVAAQGGTPVSPDELEPNYLRLSQAERDRIKKQGL